MDSIVDCVPSIYSINHTVYQHGVQMAAVKRILNRAAGMN